MTHSFVNNGGVTGEAGPGESVRLRGCLVAGKWTRSQPTDIVEVSRSHLRFSPWLRDSYEIERDQLQRIEVERIRMPPFWWSTDFAFVLTTGRTAPKRFSPLRPKHTISVLRETGWPVAE